MLVGWTTCGQRREQESLAKDLLEVPGTLDQLRIYLENMPMY